MFEVFIIDSINEEFFLRSQTTFNHFSRSREGSLYYAIDLRAIMIPVCGSYKWNMT